MRDLPGPKNSVLAYAAEVEWSRRLHLTMDWIEDTFFDYPARARERAEALPELFAIYPRHVTSVHRLRARALVATGQGLTDSLEEAETGLAEVLIQLDATPEMPQDLQGWIHAKYASVLIRLDRTVEAERIIHNGLDRCLNLRTPEVRAVRAQLQMCQAWLSRLRNEWAAACDLYKVAYDTVNHRRQIKGGYYRRGDITKAAAVVNLVTAVAYVEADPSEQLAFLEREHIKARHDIRSAWGFAPYHEVLTTEAIGRLQLAAGRILEAKANIEFAARGYLRLDMKLYALDAALYLTELEPNHQTVDQVFLAVRTDPQLSPELIDLVHQVGVQRKENVLREEIRAEIARLRERQGHSRIAA